MLSRLPISLALLKAENIQENSKTKLGNYCILCTDKKNLIKTWYKLELLSPEPMKLLGSTKKDVDKDKDGEDVPKLESADAILVHCNLVNNSYQQAPTIMFTFVSNKQFGQLITTASHLLTMLKTTNAEFQFIQFWFTDQNNRPLEIEDSVNVTLILG